MKVWRHRNYVSIRETQFKSPFYYGNPGLSEAFLSYFPDLYASESRQDDLQLTCPTTTVEEQFGVTHVNIVYSPLERVKFEKAFSSERRRSARNTSRHGYAELRMVEDV